MVVGGLGRPDTLNPLLAESEAGRALVPLLFDSLLAHDPGSGQLKPRLAETWSVSGDSRTITFTLRTDARWHDGRPVTADDVAFSIQVARDPALDSLYGPQLKYISQVDTRDRQTVVVYLDTPQCPLLSVLGELPILPQHVAIGSDPVIRSEDGRPVGSGPFVLVEWTPEGEVRLARNDAYWQTAPYLDSLSYRPFDTAIELQRALESGQIDVALMPSGFPIESLDPSPSISVYPYPAPEFLFVAFNNEHPVLSDARVRQALSMAVDREQLLDEALSGMGDLMAGSLPATHWAADPALEPPPYDPEAARQLLAEAGWSDSDGDGWLDRDGAWLRLPVRTNGGNQLREKLATLLAGYYRAIGVDASIELVIWGALVDDLFTHDFESIVFSWPLRAEPDQSGWWLSSENEIGRGYNFVSFTNATVDRLLEEALAVPGCNPDDRAALYQQVQRVLVQERPYDFLVNPYASLLARSELEGIEAGPFASPLQSAAGWHLVR
ncbi:MAG: peptide-binding protein [Anaerolineae bacterium]